MSQSKRLESQRLERGMEGMPHDVRRMRLPTFRRAPRNPRDVSKGDTVVNRAGSDKLSETSKGKESVKHPHAPTHVRNTFPEVTEHQQRIFTYTEPTAEISVGGSFMGGRSKYLDARKKRV